MTEYIKQSAFHLDAPLFTNSAPFNTAWGQPPASYYMLTVVDGVMLGQLISGVYLTTSSNQVIITDESLRPVVLQAIESTLLKGADVWKELAKL